MGQLRTIEGKLGVLLCSLLFLAGCDFPDWDATWAILTGNEIPKTKASSGPSPTASGGTEEEFSSSAAKNAKANAEILKEILLVVYNREPKDRADFGNWVDTLNQGASLEGVYNGLTHSADYRKLEASSLGTSVEALKVFGEELALLELELPVPTQFDSASASPLPSVGGEFEAPSNTEVVDFTKKIPEANASPSPKPDPKVLSEKYSKQFVGASIFTLKRVLSDEALKVMATKLEYREKLAIWYSRWVVRVAQRNVDFGVALRNKQDEAFHFKWALESSEDRVKWEVLNRIHRMLNEANRQKQ